MKRSGVVGGWIAFLAVFTLVGPLVGGMVFWLGGGLLLGVATDAEDVQNLAIGALAVSLALAPLGMVQAIITGVISGLVSRGTLSTRRWITYTTASGGAVSALSLLTVLLVYVLGRSYGFWTSLGAGVGGMFAMGALSALVCAVICHKFRPRRA